ncbi:acyltransferase-domain-containing protein [Spinellus fusiger]|nr:acyltransferase-domain-containing protein [Spinellus fusiger]
MVLSNTMNMITGLSFPKRIIVMSNHQTYADWLYIWCVAYLSKAHGDIKIILKDSLKGLPGMQYFDFIFIKRKLALDKEVIEDNLVQTKVHQQPMWLVLFPEGTVISENTRQSSAKYAKANDLKTNAHTLLPRSTGLRLCTESLGDSVEWLYDFTIGYSGLSSTDIPEDVYSIPKIFFFQKYPEKIHLHLRRFATKDIPQAPEAYATWLQQRWAEKDDLLAYFYKHQHFPTEKTDTHEFPVALRNPWFELILVYLFTLPYIPFTYVAWPTLSTYAKKYTG